MLCQFGYNAGEQIECCASLGIMQGNRLSVVLVWVRIKIINPINL